MANYKYRMTDHDFILTKEEHQLCVSAFKRGQNIMILRDGDVIINMAMLRSARKTNELTDEQENNRIKQYELPAAPQDRTFNSREAGLTRLSDHDFRNKMGWPHTDTCSCKKIKESTKT